MDSEPPGRTNGGFHMALLQRKSAARIHSNSSGTLSSAVENTAWSVQTEVLCNVR